MIVEPQMNPEHEISFSTVGRPGAGALMYDSAAKLQERLDEIRFFAIIIPIQRKGMKRMDSDGSDCHSTHWICHLFWGAYLRCGMQGGRAFLRL